MVGEEEGEGEREIEIEIQYWERGRRGWARKERRSKVEVLGKSELARGRSKNVRRKERGKTTNKRKVPPASRVTGQKPKEYKKEGKIGFWGEGATTKMSQRGKSKMKSPMRQCENKRKK